MDIDQMRTQLPGTGPALMRYARLLTADEQDAAHLVQDTLLRGLQAADRFERRSSLSTRLRRLMHNEAQWRSDDCPADVAERAQTRDDLREALTHLPSIYRTAVVLHDAEDLTVAEIAQINDIGIPAAKRRLRRGRMMLVSALAEARTPPQRGVPMRCWDARSQVSD